MIGVRGPDAARRLDTCFQRATGGSLTELPCFRLAFGHWRSTPNSAGEELLIVRRGETWFEVQCHGGTAAPDAILESLIARGAQRLDPQDWLERESTDRITAAAEQQLLQARTARTAAILATQRAGALQDSLRRIVGWLQCGDAEAARIELDTLLARAPLGRHLTVPWTIALVGRPNAGKSSLINALLGYRRALVADQPGTTRDVVTANTAWDGWPLEFADTAGIRPTDDELEAAGMAAAEACRRTADLTLLVCDLTVPWTVADQHFLATLHHPLIVHNKCDLVECETHDAAGEGRPPGWRVSARTGVGLTELLNAVVQRLLPAPPPPTAAVPFTRELIDVLQAARHDLPRGDLARASQRLNLYLLPRTEPAAEDTVTSRF